MKQQPLPPVRTASAPPAEISQAQQQQLRQIYKTRQPGYINKSSPENGSIITSQKSSLTEFRSTRWTVRKSPSFSTRGSGTTNRGRAYPNGTTPAGVAVTRANDRESGSTTASNACNVLLVQRETELMLDVESREQKQRQKQGWKSPSKSIFLSALQHEPAILLSKYDVSNATVCSNTARSGV